MDVKIGSRRKILGALAKYNSVAQVSSQCFLHGGVTVVLGYSEHEIVGNQVQ